MVFIVCLAQFLHVLYIRPVSVIDFINCGGSNVFTISNIEFKLAGLTRLNNRKMAGYTTEV